MRRLRAALAVLVALALLGAVVWFGDRWVRSEVEERVRATVEERLPELGGVDVEVDGALVLPQLIRGDLDRVTVTADELALDGVAVTDVEVVASGVPVRGDGTVDHVTATATAPADVVVAAVERRIDLPDTVVFSLRDGEVALSGTVLLVRLEAFLRPVVQPRAIAFEVDRIVIGGATVSAADVPVDLDALVARATIDLDVLPESVELSDVVITPDGVDLTLVGEDVGS